jgi:Ice-binding-like
MQRITAGSVASRRWARDELSSAHGGSMFKRLPLVVPVVLFTGTLVALSPLDAFAATAPNLGTALNFTVLAGSTITNTGPSVITGNLGLDPGSSVTGFPPGTVTGVKHISDAVALQAKNDLSTAYTEAANAPVTTDMTGLNLGGKNLTPGVYKFDSSAQLTGPLTLSGNGIYIFQIGSTLTTASNSVVLTTNGAQACGVFWQVGSSATLGSATHFQGTLMALTSITMVTGANIISGRAMARNGALTLDANDVTPPVGTCTVGSGGGGSGGGGGGSGGGGSGGSGGSGGAGGPGTTGTSGPVPVPDTGLGGIGFMVPALLVIVGGVSLAASRRTRAHGSR